MRLCVLQRWALILALWVGSGTLHAAETLVVIAHPDSELGTLSRVQVVNLFLGRHKKLPSGVRAVVLDNLDRKAQFYEKLVNRTLAEINAYWVRLKFSGQTIPPRQVSESAILDLVAATPGALGYADKSVVDGRVRIVHELAR